MSKFAKWIGLAAVLVLAAAPAFAARAKGPAKQKEDEHFTLVLTTDTIGQAASSEFSCNDKIYAYLRLPHMFTGKHHLRVDWYRPDGKLQDSANLDLNLDPPGQNLVYAWLQCHVPDVEDTVDLFFNSDDGAEFDGVWRVEMIWDGKKAKAASFTVVCE